MWHGRPVNAGFNEGAEIWLPISSKYFYVNQEWIELLQTETLTSVIMLYLGSENTCCFYSRMLMALVDLAKVFKNISSNFILTVLS